jgi:spermidine synthase
MKPTVVLAEATTPEGAVLTLLEHDGNYFLQADGAQLMTSFAHGSEEELARMACAPFRSVRQPRILIGGLGLGFTLAEACRALPQKRAVFEVGELIPEIVDWNRQHLAHLHPGLWEDARVEVRLGDVAELVRSNRDGYHAILLDIDNGPEAFTGQHNNALYRGEGLANLRAALKDGGLLAVWSATDDPGFERRLQKAGFDVTRETVAAAHKGKRKRQHIIWLARKGQFQSPHRRTQ